MLHTLRRVVAGGKESACSVYKDCGCPSRVKWGLLGQQPVPHPALEALCAADPQHSDAIYIAAVNAKVGIGALAPPRERDPRETCSSL